MAHVRLIASLGLLALATLSAPTANAMIPPTLDCNPVENPTCLVWGNCPPPTDLLAGPGSIGAYLDRCTSTHPPPKPCEDGPPCGPPVAPPGPPECHGGTCPHPSSRTY